MTDHADVTQITPTTRIVIDYDDDPLNPRTDYDTSDVSFHPIVVGRSYNRLEPGRNTHEDTLDEILNWTEPSRVEDEVAKHFARAGIAYEIHEFTSQRDFVGRYICYWDPSDEENEHPMALEQQERAVRAHVAEYQDYSDGLVYIVTLERVASYAAAVNAGEGLVDFESLYDPGDDEPEWEPVESCGGYIGLNLWWSPTSGIPLTDMTPELVATDLATLTPTEQAAIQPHLDAFNDHLRSIGVPVP